MAAWRYHCRMDLVPYVVNFLVIAAVPFVLGAWGTHLAGSVLDPPKRRRVQVGAWGLVAFGTVVAALQQYEAFDSDSKHEAAQQEMQRKLNEADTKLEQSIRGQENMKGQLTSLALVMNTLAVSLPKSAGVGQDVIKAFASALSMAFAQATKSPPTQSQPAPSVQPTPSPTDPLSPEIRLKRMVGHTEAMLRRFDSFTSDEQGRLLRDHYPKLVAAKDNKAETDKENARFRAASADMLSDRNKQFARLRAQALILRTQLLALLPPQPNDDAVTAVLDDSNYKGGSAYIVANYLQKLASQLPDK
jgi:hypothetical protein